MELTDFLAATSKFLIVLSALHWFTLNNPSNWLLTIPPHAVIYSRLAIDFRDRNYGKWAFLRPAMYVITMEMLKDPELPFYTHLLLMALALAERGYRCGSFWADE